MSAATIWILFPVLLAIILFVLQQNRVLVLSLAGVSCFLLAMAAVLLPIGETFKVGSLTTQIPSTLTILGRQFILLNGDRTYLTLVYSLGAVWFLVGGITLAHRYFVPMGMAVLGVLVAAFAVEPFFYAALLVEIAVLLSVPILTSPGSGVQTGVQRFVIFQTLAVPFILLAGWILGFGEVNPTSELFQARSALFLGLGFAFWLAVFPFHSWVPLLAEQSHPFPVGFVLSVLPLSALLLGLDFLNGFAFLRSTPQLYEILKIVGVLMIVLGGLFAAIQNDLSRMMGYAVIFQTGYAVLTIGLNSLPGLLAFAAGILPTLLGILVLVIALSVLANQEVGYSFKEIRGLLRKYPFVAIGFVIAYCSIGGLPLLAGFPVRQETLGLLSSQSLTLTVWAFIGNLAFLLGGARILAEFVDSAETSWSTYETIPQRILLVFGTFFIVLFGIFPNTFLKLILFILRSFPVMLQ